MEEKTFSLDFAGRKLSAKFSNLAEQADGAVLVTYGGTIALVTSVLGKRDRLELDYFPLTVEYEEKYYAAGKIYGSRFIRRESRPTEIAVLTGRMIDRTIRPRFDHRLRREVQVVVTILSADGESDPDFPGLLGASLALGSSPIPFRGPVAGVRIAEVGERLIVNPTYQERQGAGLDIFVAGTSSHINMLDADARGAPEKNVIRACELAQQEIEKLCRWQEEILREIQPAKAEVLLQEPSADLAKIVKDFTSGKLEEAIFTPAKVERQSKIGELKRLVMAHLAELGKEKELGAADTLFEKEVDRIVHEKIVAEEKRPDGRKLNEVRPIEIQLGVLPRAHGSALFMRGNTQALSVTTLGAPGDVLLQQGMEVTGEKRFMHHYNFPPYSVGETGFFRGPGRREIGHGALAERAIAPFIPPKETFPYTIRVVSEILSSNGSSSMASVCGTSLSLMQAGVPIKEHVAGIAMGLMVSGEPGIRNQESGYKILTDIQGPEDHHGDMDCKIAGTKQGIAAMQMDVKIEGITIKMLEEILAQAREARIFILEKMYAAIPQPSPDLSPYAPRIITIEINPDRIRDVIGPGGKMINTIIAETGVQIDIEDTGLIFITAENEEAAGKAVEWIKNLTRELKVGEIMQGKVIKILDFGAIVELLPHQEGMVHISELATFHVREVGDIVKVGDVIPVKIKEIQPDGRIRLSLKDARRELGETPPAPAEVEDDYSKRPPIRSSTRHRRKRRV